MAINEALADFIVLDDREQYAFCHVKVPDLDDRLPAIATGENFYSLFRALPNAIATMRLAIKLLYESKDKFAIVKLTKGYVVWVFEPKATTQKELTKLRSPQTSKIIVSSKQYKPADIKVPHQNSQLTEITLPGIVFEGEYYSMVEAERDEELVFNMVARLGKEEQQTAIVRLREGYIVFRHEPKAQPTDSIALSIDFMSANDF